MIKKISDEISYVESSENPLSADIGIIHDGNETWLFDVGADIRNLDYLKGEYNIVISHFHQDHMGILDKVSAKNLYVSKQTCKYSKKGIITESDVYIGNLHIFPVPSTHAKGCLGLEVNEKYAFVGDALYGKEENGKIIYNVQFLKAQIDLFKKLKADYLLISHLKGLVKEKKEVISGLEKIYQQREKTSPFITIKWEDLPF